MSSNYDSLVFTGDIKAGTYTVQLADCITDVYGQNLGKEHTLRVTVLARSSIYMHPCSYGK